MRISHVLTAAAVVASVGFMAGCSGSGSVGTSSVLPGANGIHSRSVMRDGTGVAPQYLASIHFGSAVPAVRPNSGALKKLAVSDFGSGAVEVLNGSYVLTQTITNGLNGPDGDWYDENSNLYVANYNGIVVQEYLHGGSTPSFSYTAGLGDPINVATDEHGHVFVADYNFGGAGFINEYKQGTNTVLHTCAPGGAAEGLAIGENGQVFVSYNNSSGTANIAEYKHGLTGCNETVLNVTLNFAGGMQLDKNNNLVACDQTAGAVDIIKPPYNSVNSSITGIGDPFHVALNKSNSMVFIADLSNADVAVDNYPSGSSITVLNGANGLSDPAGVATKPFQH